MKVPCSSPPQVQSRRHGTLSPSPPGGDRFAPHASSPTMPQALCWPPSLLTVRRRPASPARLTARLEKSASLISFTMTTMCVCLAMTCCVCVCVSVTVRVGGGVPGVGAVGGVCSPAGGCAGAADSAVGASCSGGSSSYSTLLHQNTVGGRHW